MGSFRRLLLERYIAETPVVTTRKVSGYSGASTVKFFYNGSGHSISVDSSTGAWEYEIPSGTVITSLEGMFSADADNGGYDDNNKISYIRLNEIGDTSSNTSLAHAFNNCTALTSVSFATSFNTTSVTTIEDMFAGCYALVNSYIDMFVLSAIPESSATSAVTSNVYYTDTSYGTSSLTDVHLNFIPERVSTNFFHGCAALTELYVNSIKYTFKVSDCPVLSSASIDRMIAALYDWSTSSSKPNDLGLYFEQTVRDTMTSTQENSITAKGWEIYPTKSSSNVYIEHFATGDNVSYVGTGSWYSNSSVESSKLVMLLSEEASDTGYGQVCITIPNGYDASTGLIVTVNHTMASNSEVINGYTVSNNYSYLYMQVEDASGNKTSANIKPDDGEDCDPGETYTNVYTISTSGLTASAIKKIYLSFISTSDSLKQRRKATRIDYIKLTNSATE